MVKEIEEVMIRDKRAKGKEIIWNIYKGKKARNTL